MKELSIHISDADVDGFSYWMTSGSFLLFKRHSAPGETISSVIGRECIKTDIRIKVIWNSRGCILIPSSIFRIEDMNGYLHEISDLVRYPQCIQCGEFVAVWDADGRIEEIRDVSEKFGVAVLHTHQRVEHIASAPSNATSASLIGNLLYICSKNDSLLEDSFTAEVYEPEDVLYYLSMAHNGQRPLLTSLPDDWTALVSQYFDIVPQQ